jgi:hypothetical protein
VVTLGVEHSGMEYGRASQCIYQGFKSDEIRKCIPVSGLVNVKVPLVEIDNPARNERELGRRPLHVEDS